MFEILSTIKPEIIVAGGTTIALLYLIYTNRLRDKEWNRLLTNHLEHEQESRDKLTRALERLISKITSFKRGLQGIQGIQGIQGERGEKGEKGNSR